MFGYFWGSENDDSYYRDDDISFSLGRNKLHSLEKQIGTKTGRRRKQKVRFMNERRLLSAGSDIGLLVYASSVLFTITPFLPYEPRIKR